MTRVLDGYPRVRRVLYLVQFVVTGVTTLVAVGYAAAGAALPSWFGVASAVLSALWSYLGMTAARNVVRGVGGRRNRPLRDRRSRS